MTLETQDIEMGFDAAMPAIAFPTQKELEYERSLQLVYTLHSSLDIKTILQQFAQAVRHELPCDGIRYKNGDQKISIHIGSKTENILTYNLSINDTGLGTLEFSREQSFQENEIIKVEELLCLLLHPMKNALEHLDAVRSAMHDPLTNLYNRTALQSAMRRDIELAKRYGTPFSILALDLDHFKNINDTYGHGGGDQFLMCFSAIARETVRDSDMIFRVGGEEFVVLLTKTDLEGAINLADRIKENVANMVCEYGEKFISTTTSVGVSTYISGDDKTSILERADEALYRAKNHGRNQVCL